MEFKNLLSKGILVKYQRSDAKGFRKYKEVLIQLAKATGLDKDILVYFTEDQMSSNEISAIVIASKELKKHNQNRSIRVFAISSVIETLQSTKVSDIENIFLYRIEKKGDEKADKTWMLKQIEQELDEL
ncbi:hypothetical protein ACFL5V_09705 [Fibrobacterota bacterium]